MIRLFIAIDFPEEIKEMLGHLCYGLPGARWVSENQLHLTLRFIGEVDEGMFQDIRDDLACIKTDPLTLVLKGTGFFPPRKKPRIIWVGLKKNDRLIRLRNRLERKLITLGLEPESRKFSPHITLARLKNTPVSKVSQFMSSNNLFRTPPFPILEFHLYSSFLSAKGAIHQREASYPLTTDKRMKQDNKL